MSIDLPPSIPPEIVPPSAPRDPNATFYEVVRGTLWFVAVLVAILFSGVLAGAVLFGGGDAY